MPLSKGSFRLLMRAVFLLSLAYVTWGMLSSSPATGFGMNDKVAHFLIFGWLALTLDASGLLSKFHGKFQWDRSGWWLLTAVLAVYGGLLEITQYFIPLRSMSFLDWVADIAGIVTYCFGIERILKLWPGVSRYRWQ